MGIQGIDNLKPEGFEPSEHDDEDVAAALGRDTQDGPGPLSTVDQLPPSDFEENSSDDDRV